MQAFSTHMTLSGIVNMGVNPYKSTVMFVLDEGTSISMPEHVEDQAAIRWFSRSQPKKP